jgi:hypothetical protein
LNFLVANAAKTTISPIDHTSDHITASPGSLLLYSARTAFVSRGLADGDQQHVEPGRQG